MRSSVRDDAPEAFIFRIYSGILPANSARGHALHALVLGEEVFGAVCGDGGYLLRDALAHLRRGERRRVHLPQNVFPERFGNGGHVAAEWRHSPA